MADPAAPPLAAATGFDMRGFIENSLLEWENTVAAVVIAGGCNFRCPYCHSWRYVTGVDDLERLDPQILFDLLERQKGWIDGVVFTGGEPTLQPGLTDLIRRTRAAGVRVKLHTNGSRPEVVAGLLDEGLLDCLALDYKAPLDGRYFAAAGVPEDTRLLEDVKRSFALAAAAGVDREYHTTLSPRHVDLPTLEEMAADLAPGGLWILQQYENLDCLDAGAAGRQRFDAAMLDALEAAARRRYPRVLGKRGTSA
ncbi:MAG: anaerobic ribonucleoside-triphosphate reductase activating protein [Planctomycetes bacterium]|nr:anaerobic ribonucleoside-triphosphate reductase activating protein [Planctomycetota bacterium]